MKGSRPPAIASMANLSGRLNPKGRVLSLEHAVALLQTGKTMNWEMTMQQMGHGSTHHLVK